MSAMDRTRVYAGRIGLWMIGLGLFTFVGGVFNFIAFAARGEGSGLLWAATVVQAVAGLAVAVGSFVLRRRQRRRVES